jgi:hypothetical protein
MRYLFGGHGTWPTYRQTALQALFSLELHSALVACFIDVPAL